MPFKYPDQDRSTGHGCHENRQKNSWGGAEGKGSPDPEEDINMNCAVTTENSK
jgi:hypothetical protein